MTPRRLLLVLGVPAVSLAAALAVALYLADGRVQETPQSAGAPAIGGPFTLVDHRGRAVSEADYRGKLMVVYFGYTFCPDVCPTGLYKIARALDALGEDAAQVQALFITVDPQRDTVEALADYVAGFHPDLVGLTGSPERVKAAAEAYRVYSAKAYPEGVEEGGADYLVDHSTLTYVMGRDGDLLETAAHRASVDDLVAAIRKHL